MWRASHGITRDVGLCQRTLLQFLAKLCFPGGQIEVDSSKREVLDRKQGLWLDPGG
jgi:hypothetical protein